MEARKIATSRLCNDKEVDEVLASAKKYFFANYTNKVGNHYEQEIGRSNCSGFQQLLKSCGFTVDMLLCQW